MEHKSDGAQKRWSSKAMEHKMVERKIDGAQKQWNTKSKVIKNSETYNHK